MRGRVLCQKCQKPFWARVQKDGTVMDALCEKCEGTIRREEMEKKHNEVKTEKLEKKKLDHPEEFIMEKQEKPPQPVKKIKIRFPDEILNEIRWLEWQRTIQMTARPKREQSVMANLRMLMAHEIMTNTINKLYQELEIAERLLKPPTEKAGEKKSDDVQQNK